jgi:PAS domain S-box-containing protein
VLVYGQRVHELPATLVIVDDAAEVRSLVKQEIAVSGGFAVVGEGASGSDAIELAERHRPTMMLLDVSMPGMDGLQALPDIRQVAPDTLVVIYTGFDEPGLARRARELGATAVLEKSLAAHRLSDQLSAIRRDAALTGIARPPRVAAAARDVLDEHVVRFRETFEEAAIGMATMTLTGTVVRGNRVLAEMLERDARDLAGAQYRDFAVPHDFTKVERAIADAQEGTGQVVRFEHEVETRGGTRLVLATAAPVRDALNRPLYLFLQLQDITAQRSAEEELRQSEERFRLLVEAVEDYAIFLLDADGRIASWNAGAERINGYTADEIIGAHFRVFYPPDKQAVGHPEHELALALRDGHYEEEDWRIRKDGTRFWASVLITAIRDRDGTHIGFAKVTRNIDERRRMLLDLERAATELAATNAELEAANDRLAREAADQAQFLAVTAHELRTPISVLSGSTTLLVDHWAEMTDEDRAELSESVRSSAARLQRLLRDLLTASRLESRPTPSELSLVDLGDVLARVVSAARAAAPEADISLDCPPESHVLGERDQLAQIFDNLLGNALRHGAPPVVVRVRPVGDDRVEVAVSDAGPGVEPALRDRLFQRFAAGGRRSGTGLGLFIVRELARSYGGDAWYVAPERGQGGFVVSLRCPESTGPTPPGVA